MLQQKQLQYFSRKVRELIKISLSFRLGGDLVKIKEGFADEIAAVHDERANHHENYESGDENADNVGNNSNHSSPDEPQIPLNLVTTSVRYYFNLLYCFANPIYN